MKYPIMSDDYKEREIGEILVGRNYELFGWLAQVRTQQSEGYDPRGLPEDISEDVQKIRDEYGEHTPSYLTLEELLVKPEIGKIARFREEVIHWIDDYAWDSEKGTNDNNSVRIVFWFDS